MVNITFMKSRYDLESLFRFEKFVLEGLFYQMIKKIIS